MARRQIMLIGMLFALGACTPTGKAFEAAAESKIDEGVDFVLERLCKGPVDIAVRTVERYPALGRAVFEICPDTYGRLRSILLDEVIRGLPQRLDSVSQPGQ